MTDPEMELAYERILAAWTPKPKLDHKPALRVRTRVCPHGERGWTNCKQCRAADGKARYAARKAAR